jgi:hypothetical protein
VPRYGRSAGQYDKSLRSKQLEINKPQNCQTSLGNKTRTTAHFSDTTEHFAAPPKKWYRPKVWGENTIGPKQ